MFILNKNKMSYFSMKFKGRVTNKSNIKSYASGRCFHVDLIDASGEIRCTVFDPLVDQFINMFEVC